MTAPETAPRVSTRRRHLVTALAIVGALSVPGWLVAAAFSLPHTFANGSVANADQVNANFAAVVNRTPESFCANSANLGVNQTITCPPGRVFVGPVFGGRFFASSATCPSAHGGAIPTPNVRFDDDAAASSNDVHWATFGCNGLNACTVNSAFSGTVGVYLGTCW